MNENKKPVDQTDADAARMLISPPPEEELQRTRTHLLKPFNGPKRKRGGTPNKQQDPQEATPNPKPRKTHRRRSSQQQAQDSPTRPSFARNPDADYVPRDSLVSAASARRSVTPYEPPTDVFTPPREILLAPTPAPKSSRGASTKPQGRTTPQPRPRTATPLRVVVHSVKKEPLPAIDLARPMTPPSPTDDPLLLLPSSSSPLKRRASTARFHATYHDDEYDDERPATSSDAAYAPIDWTVGLDVDAQDDNRTSDSMDLDPPASFDGPPPHTLSLALPHTPTQPTVSFTSAGWDSDDDDEDAGALPVRPVMSFTSTLVRPAHPTPALSTLPPSTTATHINGNTPAAFDFLQPTKPDPPTPRTQARAEAWGVWGSPFPGRGEAGEGSFRMDGRRRGGDAGLLAGHGLAPSAAQEQGGEQEEENEEASAEQEDADDSDASMEEGVSILRALREEDARRRAGRRSASSARGSNEGVGGPRQEDEEDEQEEEDGDEDEDEDEAEEAEVRAMSVDPEPEDDALELPAGPPAQHLLHGREHEERQEEERRFVVRTPSPLRPSSAFDFSRPSLDATTFVLPTQVGGGGGVQQRQAAQTPPYRWAPGHGGAQTPAVRRLVLGGAAPAPTAFASDSEPASVRVEQEMHPDGGEREKRVYTALGMRAPQSLLASPSKERLGNEHVHVVHREAGEKRARARASFGRVDPGAVSVSALPRQEPSNTEAGVQVDVDGEDDSGGEEEEEDAALLGLVKITSADPRAAARAAAILKQHDYDCFTRLRHSSAKERERRRHSYGGVGKSGSNSPLRTSAAMGAGRMQDIAVLRAQAGAHNSGFDSSYTANTNPNPNAKETGKDKEKKARRQSARVVGERVYFPGSPKPVTTAELLAEAEREVARGVGSPSASASARVDGGGHAERTTPRRVPLPESDSEDDDESDSDSDGQRAAAAAATNAQSSTAAESSSSNGKTWGKPEWKALDACFTDERIAVAARLGMVLNLVPAPAPGTAFSTPVRPSASAAGHAGYNATAMQSNTNASAVMMASADAVDLGAVVARFVDARGGEGVVCSWGPGWDLESLIQRARALQIKQRAGHVAPPTPNANNSASAAKSSFAFPAREGGGVFAGARRQASMVVPDFTPLGKRAMPPRVSGGGARVNAVAGSSDLANTVGRPRPRLPAPVLAGAPFSQLPPTPEPLRKRRVPGSLFAPRYSHLLEEAVAVSGSGKGKERAVEREEEEEEERMEDGEEEEQQQDESFSTDPDSSLDADAEMAPATPLREREEAALYAQPAATAAPASMGKRMKGFLFSYLPTLAKTAPPTRTAALLARPRLPLPPLELLEKPRGPVVTPVRPPLPKTRAPKELVSLQPAPPVAKKTGIPRRAPPRRMVELNHVEMPVEGEPLVRVGPRPRTSSGGSVKDLVKNFERLDKEKEKEKARGAEVKRVRSVGDFGGNNNGRKGAAAAGAGRPVWR
ncbi:hypothetical protein C8F04DRAFT_1403023 [Mycena alexandri]|uniref:Uncharacterized protein n=1 Tax=Mycena alexandri TaxID=1745969 RepID=A0AAD6S546_9AGAR|nr:hypothetical protein C8F04DRAFT_1403023 [Mycena alexandri]